MPASVALVHDDPAFVKDAVSALERAGFHVVAFTDPLEAMEAIPAAQSCDTLITRVTFPLGKSNGISLALYLRTKLRDLNIVFVAREEQDIHTTGLGVLIPHPVDYQALIAAIRARPTST